MVHRIVILVLVALVGCSGGYRYIPPVTDAYIPADVDPERDLIPYCTLTMGHFQADEPPPAYQTVKNQLGAASVIIVYAARALVHPVEVLANPDSARWEACVEDMTWEARFITKASWWSPKSKGDDAERILEHEQGHFAIMERETRKENADMAAAIERTRVTAATLRMVTIEARKRLAAERERVSDKVQAWNAKYDLETKNGSDKEAQREWTALLQKQLEETD